MVKEMKKKEKQLDTLKVLQRLMNGTKTIKNQKNDFKNIKKHSFLYARILVLMYKGSCGNL